MGFGGVDVVEKDLVENSNRNRQLYQSTDVGKPKACALLRNLSPYAVWRTSLRGYYMSFEEWLEQNHAPVHSAIVCAVDNAASLFNAARYGLSTQTPVVFANVSTDGEACRIFIQRPGVKDACFACYRPHETFDDRDRPCVPVPAIADILQVAVGFAARALVGEIHGVPIGDYNCRDLTFTGFDIVKQVAKRIDCKICGGLKSL